MTLNDTESKHASSEPASPVSSSLSESAPVATHERDEHSLCCPRCLYDVSVVPCEWQTQCPVNGRCSECGLLFAWRDVFAGQGPPPRWCVESSEGVFAFLKRIATTLLRLLLFRSFWAGIRMEQRVRWGRLMIFMLVLTAAVPVSAMLTRAMEYGVWHMVTPSTSTLTQTGQTSDWIVFGKNIRLTRVENGQTVNRGSASLLPHALPVWIRPAGSSAMVVNVITSIWLPLAHLLAALTFLVLPVSRRRAKIARRHFLRPVLYSLALVMIVHLVVVVIAAWEQFMSGGWAPRNVFALTSPSWWGGTPPRWIVRLQMAVPDGFPPVIMVFLLVFGSLYWWYRICRNYFRMEQAFFVALSVITIGILLPPTAMVLVSQAFDL